MTDIQINPGVRGQTRSTWRDETHLRGVLLRLSADASREELVELYLAKVERRRLRWSRKRCAAPSTTTGCRSKPAPSPHVNVEAKAAAVTATVENIKALVLLDLVQPNGKKLRDCTGAEVRKLAAQMPSWFKAIAAKVKPKEIVGLVLSEAEIRKMAPDFIREMSK